MQHLLIQDTFDSFLFCEGQICTASTFDLNGRINQEFFDAEELSSMTDSFVLWKNIRNIAFDMIKGKKVPTKMKLVFALSSNRYADILKSAGVSHSPSEIGGLYLHILYEKDEITLITGTTLNIFTLDKTLDKFWDKTITSFLEKHFDIEEI